MKISITESKAMADWDKGACAILYAGHSVILITFVAKTAMFDNGVTQCPCP
jgi:hypothetical protein